MPLCVEDIWRSAAGDLIREKDAGEWKKEFCAGVGRRGKEKL